MSGWIAIDPLQLATINLFAEFTEDELLKAARLSQVETFRRNALIIAEGTRGDRLYLILHGSVRVSKQIPGVGEEALAILPTGTYFGEMSLFDDLPRSADVYADARTTVLSIGNEELRALLASEPVIASKFLWAASRTMAERVREANAKVTFLSAAGQFG
jgi:CRP-like cAMP-binding protein